MKRRLVLGAVGVALIWFGYWLRGCLAVDTRMDGGGQWDYVRQNCDYPAIK